MNQIMLTGVVCSFVSGVIGLFIGRAENKKERWAYRQVAIYNSFDFGEIHQEKIEKRIDKEAQELMNQ